MSYNFLLFEGRDLITAIVRDRATANLWICFLSVNLGDVLTFSGTTTNGNHTLFSLFSPALPSPLQVVPFSCFWKNAIGCPCGCLQGTACPEKAVPPFLEIHVLNPFLSSITAVLVTLQLPSSSSGILCTWAPHFPISHQHMPKSCREIKQERIWDWSGAACFSSASQEIHIAQWDPLNRQMVWPCGPTWVSLFSSATCRNLDIFEASDSQANWTAGSDSRFWG